MTPEARRQALRALAQGLDRIDVEVYRAVGRDPLEPILGAGDPSSPVCIFGRDPGRDEVKHAQPFVGVGGQKIRRALHAHLHGVELPDFEASLAVGRHVFWANTVPYKPVGNKAWPVRVVRSFAPIVRDLLVHRWVGRDVLAMGRVAFFWFAGDKATKARLAAHWSRDDRFETSIAVPITAPDGTTKEVTVHPVPHPSPLNATWAPHVPRLLAMRLASVGLQLDADGSTP